MESGLKRRRLSNENYAGTKPKRRQIQEQVDNGVEVIVKRPYQALRDPSAWKRIEKVNQMSKYMESPTKGLSSRFENIVIDDKIEFRTTPLTETEDLCLAGEEDVSDESEDSSSDEADMRHSLPVRILDNFSFFDENAIGEVMVGLDDIEEPDSDRNISPYFVGYVTSRNAPLGDGDDKEVSNPGSTGISTLPVLMRSSSILSIWESEEPERDGILSEYSDIWVQTTYAWYILDRPAPAYRSLYLPRWLHHSLYIMIIHLLQRHIFTVDMFKQSFLQNEAKWAFYEFGRELTLKDLRERMPEVLRTLIENIYDISDRSFIEDLCAEYAPHLALYPESVHSHSSYSGSDTESTSGSSTSSSTVKFKYKRRYGDRPVTGQKDSRLTPTFTTDFIHNLAEPYYPSLRRRRDESHPLEQNSPASLRIPSILLPNSPPQSIKIKRLPGVGSNELEWVKIWNHKYTRGDIALIRYKETPDEVHPENLQESVWFGLIIRLSCDEGVTNAHVVWLVPARHTSLNQLGHPQELVAIDECEDVDVETFVGVCQHRKLGQEEDEPGINESNMEFFYRNQALNSAFYETDPQDPCCPSCRNETKACLAGIASRTAHGITFNGIEYHVYDTVYIAPLEQEEVYIIGQIEKFEGDYVRVREFQRISRPEDSRQFYNDRFLTIDGDADLVEYLVRRLDGKCQVLENSPILPSTLREDVFYLDDHVGLPKCRFCLLSAKQNAPGKALKALDLFSGAGGLSLGLESTSSIEIDWAVEYDPSASQTFRDIHPNCEVYTICLNQLLRHTWNVDQGMDVPPLYSPDTNETLPPFPVEGDVDIIVGGPPCQGFSRINRFARADDPRNDLILTFLSAVEMLKPKYVLLENVRGILTYRLGGQQAGISRIEGGIKGGMVMLIKRILTALNYQVRHGVLHAGHYGSPQVRRRVIFLASKRGTSLPEFPQPTHLAINTQNLNTNVVAKEPYSFMVNKRKNQAAPLGPVTVIDTIGDLPGWEWENPHVICPATLQSKLAAKKRSFAVSAISCFQNPSPTFHVSGPRDPMSYGWSPATLYQLLARGNEDVIFQHFAPLFNVKVIERVCSIPLRLPRGSDGFPDYDDLPEELKYEGRKFHSYAGSYGRLQADSAFSTAIGSLSPDRPSQVIHPTQHRVLTIREFARAQGFPDRVTFQTVSQSIKQITKQIGNAVPVQMAIALGREIVKAEARTRAEEKARQRRASKKSGWVAFTGANRDTTQNSIEALKENQFWVPMVPLNWK